MQKDQRRFLLCDECSSTCVPSFFKSLSLPFSSEFHTAFFGSVDEVFAEGVGHKEWDRIRIILRQPFARKQFGLQFIDIIPDDKLTEASQESDYAHQSLAAFRRLIVVNSQ